MLSNKEEQNIKLALKHSSVNKGENIKKLLAANMEKVAERVETSLDQNQGEI